MPVHQTRSPINNPNIPCPTPGVKNKTVPDGEDDDVCRDDYDF
jgi:hypothetical protein